MKREVWLDAIIQKRQDHFIHSTPKGPKLPNPLIKEDYVSGSGPKGFGYYHLFTRAAMLS